MAVAWTTLAILLLLLPGLLSFVGGKKVVDKAENELVSGETLTALKKQSNPIPDESGLSKEDKQKIIGAAISIAGHTHSKDHSEDNRSFHGFTFIQGDNIAALGVNPPRRSTSPTKTELQELNEALESKASNPGPGSRAHS